MFWQYGVLVSHCATGSFAVRMTENQHTFAFQMHPSYFYWFAESKPHILHSSHWCREEILMPSIWELHYLKYFLSPGSFSVKQTPQLTAIVGALSVYSRTEAVGGKDENLLQNVKMAADLEASGSVLHPFQCPRKYILLLTSFLPSAFSLSCLSRFPGRFEDRNTLVTGALLLPTVPVAIGCGTV